MAKTSAGILLFRRSGSSAALVLLVHPGGPFWARKDAGAWSIPKGEINPGEDPLACARRELLEETGCAGEGDPVPLQALKQPSGKIVHAWAVEGDCAPGIGNGDFTMEWPPKSGKEMRFPEVDRAEWFTIEQALEKILPGQRGFLYQLTGLLERPERLT